MIKRVREVKLPLQKPVAVPSQTVADAGSKAFDKAFDSLNEALSYLKDYKRASGINDVDPIIRDVEAALRKATAL